MINPIKLVTLLIVIQCTAAAAQRNGQVPIVPSSSPRKSFMVNQDWPHKWQLIYSREYDKGDFEVKIVDKSIDTRLANILYSMYDIRFFGNGHHRYDFDDPSGRAEYESYTNGPEVDPESCTRHLSQMAGLLDELERINRNHRLPRLAEGNDSSALELTRKHILMARILNSYGRYESGVMEGLADLIGSHEQCLNNKLELDQQLVGTRYCKASFGFDADLDPSLQDKSYATYIQVGICLPNTCHSHSLKNNRHLIQRLVDSQFSMPESIYSKTHREIDDLFCLNDNNTPLRLPLSGKLFVVAAVVWLILLIGATFAGGSKLLPSKTIGDSFNMRILVRGFVHHGDARRDDKSTVNLDALNVIKVLSLVLIVMGHTILLLSNFGPDLLKSVASVRTDRIKTTLFTINQMVDTFFVISGLLFGYIDTKKFEAQVKSSTSLTQLSRLAAVVFLARYLRLVPLYAIVYWFKRSILIYLGSGPSSDPAFNQRSLYGACKREPWWTPLTPMAAYMPVGQQCLPACWSLGVEIFSMIITTPAFIMLTKRPIPTMYLLLAIGTAGWVSMYRAMFATDRGELATLRTFDGDLLYLMTIKNSPIYTDPYYRVLSVLCGLIAGRLLHYKEKERQEWPVWFSRHATEASVAAIMMTIGLYLSMPTLLHYDVFRILPENMMTHLFIISRPVWMLEWCIIALRLVTDCQNIPVIKMMSGRFGRIMSKLNLAVLLLHFDVLLIKHIHAIDNRQNYSLIKFIDDFSVSYKYTIVLATLVHVFVESPINKFTGSLLQGHKPVTNKQKHS